MLTALTLTLLVAIGLAALIAGHYMEKPEIYILGCLLMLFMGISIVNSGIAEKIGENLTTSTVANVTTTQVKNVYEQNQTVLVNGVGSLLMAIGAGAGLTFWVRRKKEKERAERDDLE